ncbi:hypothetical protein N665_0218s0087 [Sinapis alba]|nr:hypothetical protein N665_0218s0087 [Sinapis alba]
MCKRRPTNLWHFATAWLNYSKVSVCIPVKQQSLLIRIGISIPPTSRMTGTTALFTACNTSTTNLSYLENSTQHNVPLTISS